jgi:4-hydroxyisophthalate hydroxylase
VAKRYQVIIVGGGPVGMGLAVELGQRGVEVCVVERGREVGRLPKGQGLAHRTLETFWFWNCVEEIRTIRLLPPGYPIGGINAFGSLTSEYWYPSGAARDKLGPYYYQKNDRLPQYLTEEVLRGRVANLPSVTVMYESRAKQLEQDDNGVRISIASEIWPYEEQTLEADYLVGCDGTGSTILPQIGIERHGTDFETRMVLAVIYSPDFHEQTKRFGERTTFHVISPEMRGAWQFWGRVEAEHSFFYHGPVAKETTSNDSDYVHKVMEKAAGFNFNVDFKHIGFWNLRISVADTYRNGRVFIAGDAAHSHPPYGGQGLNNGIEDDRNLGWKLAAMLEGWGGSNLLDSYSAERQPVFKDTGENMIAAGILEERAWLEQHDPERGLADFEAAWAARATASETPSDVEPNYGGSPICFGLPGETSGIHSPYLLKARGGHHLAPQPLSSGKNVYEELGTGFTLLAFGVDDAQVKGFEAAAASYKVPFKVVRDTYEGGRENYESKMVLVRPDQFISWIGDEAPADPTAVVKRAIGA